MSITQNFKKGSFILSIIVALAGFLVLIGWIGNIYLFKSIFRDWNSMKANAAICFFLAGIIVLLVNRKQTNSTTRWVASALSLIIFFTGTITLLEYIFGFDAGIDEILFKDDGNADSGLPDGRQSPTSAAYFMFFGLTYLPGNNRFIKIYLFQVLHIASGIIILMSLMSYILGSFVITGVSLEFINVVHSTFSFLLLILAVLFSQPEVGIMKQVSNDTIGGKVIRKSLPLVILIFIVIGWLRQKGEHLGLYNEALGISLFVIATIIIMGYLIFSTAASFTKSENVLIRSEERLIRANKNLELAEQQANLGNWEFEVSSKSMHWSKQIYRLFELEPAEKTPSYSEFLQLIHPEDREPVIKVFDKLQEQKDIENVIFRTNPEKGCLKYLRPTWHVVKDNKGLPVKFFGTLQDITERVETRKALKQSEEKFSKAFHSNVLGFAIYDEDFRIVDINEPYAAILENARDELLGKSSDEAGLISKINPEKREAISQEIEVMLNIDGQLSNFETEIETKNGELVTVLLSIEQLELNEKKYWLTSLIDITAKKKAEKALEESFSVLEATLESTADGILVANSQGKIIRFNKKFAELWHIPQDILLAGDDNRAIDFVLNQLKFPESFLSKVKELYAHPEAISFDILEFKDERVFERYSQPQVINGQSLGRVWSFRDVTKRKKAEEELQLSEQKYRLLFYNNPLPMWMTTLPGLDIIDVNDAAIRQYGYTREEFLKLNTRNLRPAEDLEAFLKKVDKMLPDVINIRAWRHKKKDGTIIHVVTYSHQIMYEGRRVWLGLSHDVTEEYKAKELLQKSYDEIRQLASNLQSIREDERTNIAREIHDELGQQLTGLKMDMHWLTRKLKDADAEINKKMQGCIELVNSTITTVRKIATDLRPSILDDLGLLAALEWQSEEFENRSGTKVLFDNQAGDISVAPQAATALFRIYQELLTNIARHANATLVNASLRSDENSLYFSIKDNGAGFNLNTINRKKTLGLLGIKERTLLIGGTYQIKSNPGEGTEIIISIPLTLVKNDV